jgi:SAM-dependent MidA family methyltransferase
VSAGAHEALATIDGIAVRSDLEPPVDVVLAHELLDNLPFRIVRDDREVRIGLDGDSFVERATALDDDLLPLVGDRREDELVIPTSAFAFVERIAAVLERGYALLIDYGDEGGGGPVHGYRAHQPIENVLSHPGSVDITAGVDFEWIAEHARATGLTAFPLQRQADVLRALGFETWLREELATQQEQLAAGRGLEAVRTWSARSRATMLVDPSSLGKMRWLLLATDGLPAPSWLNADQPANDRSTD